MATDEPKIDVEAPEDVDVTPTVERTSPPLPQPPSHDPYRVTFMYPEAVYGCEGTEHLRDAARQASGEHLTIEFDRGAVVDEDLAETVRKVARDEGVQHVTLRVRRRG